MRFRENDDRLMKITEAISSVNKRVNLIGVVTETSIPKQTRGTDCFVSIKIVDESRSSPPLLVSIFTETMEKLPQVSLDGDIIQFSHVVMKTNGPEVYALFNKKFSSFALFEGKTGASFVPYQLSTKFTAREQDKKFITGLRKWMTDRPVGTVSHDFKFLREIKEEERCNLLCKILHLCEVNKDEWMLFVWDGTDAPPVQVMTELNDEMENPLPLGLEAFPFPRDVLCSFPDVGTVLKITFNQCKEKLGITFLKSGKWAKFINLKCQTRSGLWHAEIMPYTRLCYLPEDNDNVLQRQRSHEERLSGKFGGVPFTCFPWHSDLTETEFLRVPFVSLMHVLTYPQATAKFRCVVRVVAMLPWEVDNFRSPNGTYRIRLTLEDPTARIHALICGSDGVTFFESHDSATSMTMKRNMLLGISETDGEVEDAGRNPPWVELCLRSYYTDKNEIWKSRGFWIFGTKFIG
ncbi:DNA metabolism protein [Lithospermum erythrorhizon]|uniref:DNA metabolism protein n=1 Tax=Lithospermum erythrorhizon TaxID=34254 RepID=A0AAV3P2U7_LITER